MKSSREHNSLLEKR